MLRWQAMDRKVLIIVDMQKDFMPGVMGRVPFGEGALPVPRGLDIVPNIVKEAWEGYNLVVATRDFHPGNHSSFKELGGKWPMHCVAGSEGAQLLPEIDMVADIILSKGQNPDKEAYSAFEGTLLYSLILATRPDEIVVTGVATEYCVLETALGALQRGFNTTVLGDCIAGVDDEDVWEALSTMAHEGVTLRTRE